jgi:hypothetical protein
MVWWKLALPVVVAGSGIAAATVAIVRSDDAVAATTAVWIDAPADLAALHPGIVVVQAHADLEAGGTLSLTVDGDTVATDGELDVFDQLAHATFQWEADAGTHELVVVASDGGRSGKHTVFVAAEGGPATTTTVSSTTSTTVAPTTTTSTTLPSTTVPTTARPTTVPPATPPPATIPKPVIGKVTITPGDCSLTVSVASFANTTVADVSVTGTPSDAPSDTPKDLDPAVAPSSVVIALRANSAATSPITITVTAGGPGGRSTSAVPFTASSCKP